MSIYQQVHDLAAAGLSIPRIARQLGARTMDVRHVLNVYTPPPDPGRTALARAHDQLAAPPLERCHGDGATPNGWLRYADLHTAQRDGERDWYWRNHKVRV